MGLEYTVVKEEEIPVELKKLIEAKKANTLRMTYATRMQRISWQATAHSRPAATVSVSMICIWEQMRFMQMSIY